LSRGIITEGDVRSHLPSGRIDWVVHAFGTVGSTSDVAARLAASGAPEGTLVVAALQTRGRGRRGNPWQSPEGGLWFSVVLRPHLPPERASGLSIAAAIAVARTLREDSGIEARIKWPNDVHVGARKIAGVMLESAPDQALVLGVGIDANISREDLPRPRWYETTSILVETGRPVDLAELLGRVLRAFEDRYFRHRGPERARLIDEWRELSVTLGEQVIVARAGEVVEGTVFGLEDDGSLIVRLVEGRHERVAPIGDVTLEVVT
jgi:BirA family biotin operon repressor/biotin-[acetyl-CoA-carboxylase] ligase